MDDYIDIYCERLGPGFWAEPFNAISNISFILAAIFAYLLALKNNALDWRSQLLVFLLLCIGMGSFSFHTLATDSAQTADVLPILLYQVAFLSLYSARVMHAEPRGTGRFIFAFFLTIAIFRQVPGDVLNGSLDYAPAFLFLAYLAWWHSRNALRERGVLILAAGTFLVSLTFRTLDMQMCPQIPLGLHFMWHILNGFLLYLTARAYILNARPKPLKS